ncbi:MAG: efflux RND transporter periplasmic adaptor subunit [Bacteroidota bacterium]
MTKKYIFSIITVVLLGIFGYILYPKFFPSKPERKILYWTDPMLPGDKSDHPGKSPMGMERVPVYADSAIAESSTTTELAPGEYYTCPMHPQVHKDQPGACPICGMTLVKKTAAHAMSESDKNNIATVSISPSKQVLANVATSIAVKMALEKEIRAVGAIDYAEPNFKQISIRFPGRLDKLYLTYTGQNVHKGDPVADVYSPEAISAQQEYLLAKDSYDEVKSQTDLISGGAQSLLDQARQKLLRWDFTEHQIAELESTKTVQKTITIHSPISGTVLKKFADPQHYASAGEDLYDVADLSTVWMYSEIYEYEVENIKNGQIVVASSDAFPGRIFTGKVIFISPTIDPSSRTAKVRIELPNPRLDLKVGMYVNARISVKLQESVVVPISAVLSTGSRQIVWIQKDGEVFQPRVVTTGERTGEYIQILDGIDEGDTIVTSGGYLIDSESQLETAMKK